MKITKTPTFKVGDKVISNDEGSLPGLIWRAEVYKVKRAKMTPDGYCYETLGRWEVTDATQLGSWYKGQKGLGLRQLWSSSLVLDESAVTHTP